MTPPQTLKSEKEKVEKGCGKQEYIKFMKAHITCGLTECLNGEIYLCPTCQARLEALNLGIQAVENMIKETLEIIDKDIELQNKIIGRYEKSAKWRVIGMKHIKSQLQKQRSEMA